MQSPQGLLDSSSPYPDLPKLVILSALAATPSLILDHQHRIQTVPLPPLSPPRTLPQSNTPSQPKSQPYSSQNKTEKAPHHSEQSTLLIARYSRSLHLAPTHLSKFTSFYPVVLLGWACIPVDETASDMLFSYLARSFLPSSMWSNPPVTSSSEPSLTPLTKIFTCLSLKSPSASFLPTRRICKTRY